MNKQLSVRGALIWSFAERYASLLVNIASTMILARVLTPTQVGVFSLCAAVSTVAGILRDFGVSEYLVQEKDLTREKLRGAFAVAIAIAWCIGIAVLLGRHTVAAYYKEPGVASVLAVLSLNFFILPLASPAFALLSREMSFRKLFVVQTTSNALQAIVAVTLALQGFGYMSLAWAPVAAITLQTIMLTMLRPRDSLLLPSFRAARGVLAYGSMFASSRVIETFTRNAHEFIIAKQFDFAAVGIFSRAFGLLELFYSNVTAVILRVATPAFASDHRAGIPLAATFARSTAIFTCLSWPFFGFLALMSADIIRVLFGSQWEAAAPIATILALAIMPSNLFVLGPNLLAVTGHVKRRLQISLWFSPVHLAGIFLASFISLQAVAAVWAVSNLLMLTLYTRTLRAILQKPASELFRPCVGSAGVAAASLASQALALLACQSIALHPLSRLVVVSLAGFIAWIGVVRLSNHPAYTEVVRIWRHFRKR